MSEPLTTPKNPPEKMLYVTGAGETKLSMPWFVKSDEVEGVEPAFVARGKTTVEPLINGAATFGKLEDAIEAATQSIDYVTWGFDPSMRFKDGGQTIGALLLKKAKAGGVRIRVLVWYAGYASSIAYGKTDGGMTESGQTYDTANLPGYDENPGEASKYTTSAQWYKDIKKEATIEFVTRALDNGDIPNDAPQQAGIGSLDWTVQKQAMLKAATHHQKMVLIDYAVPALAKGFVLGSNTLPRYWDTDDHLLHHENRRMDYVEKVAVKGKTSGSTATNFETVKKSVYFAPWQDVSAFVQGDALFDMNVNFARAWAHNGGGALEAERTQLKPKDFEQAEGVPVQVLRTQPQEGVHSISDAYFQNVLNARNFIYFENQYFRLPQLTSQISAACDALTKADRTQRLYLFAVTNIPDDRARLNTYRMLRALGRDEQMPSMTKDTAVQNKAPEPLPATQGGDQAGLQTVVCTLTTSGEVSPGKFAYSPIYTHSKVMVIDDNYFTIGSANLNARSFSTDTELNIGVADPAGAQRLRTRLWWRHRRVALEKTMAKEFEKWKQIAQKNLSAYAKATGLLIGHLTRFEDNGPVATTAYD